jgi:hypothetical protein
LVVIGHGAIAVLLFQAMGTMDVVGRKVFGAIEGEEIMPVDEGKRFKGVAPLELPKDIGEARAKGVRFDVIKDVA